MRSYEVYSSCRAVFDVRFSDSLKGVMEEGKDTSKAMDGRSGGFRKL